MNWSKESWKKKPIKQQPTYQDIKELSIIEKELSNLPPLVFAGETRNLKKELAKVCRGEAYLLQGGDCAESFDQFSANNIKDLFKILLQMAVVLTYAGEKPVVKIGRVAGQFAKPRSSDIESKDGLELPSFRGDIINSSEFNQNARIPDPSRMIKAYNQAAVTQNLLKGFARGGLADLHEVTKWNLDFVKNSTLGLKYQEMAKQIEQTLKFMESCGINPSSSPQIAETTLYTSHEALLMPYETALTREDSTKGGWYDCSAHFVWIGERTRDLDGAHIEFFRGIQNPIGVKISDKISPDELIKLTQVLNPTNEEGRLTLIVRMGADKIEENLPSLIRAIKKEGRNVIWSSDPMHGNTFNSSTNYKTRMFDKVLFEVKKFFEIHKAEGTIPGGIHLEMTGKNVTECVGGFQDITEEKLGEKYTTTCDPRLNASQALELAFLISDIMKKSKIG
ncbi:MAG: 2-keto-3-deoxy-D-arabino-heptulosonate-7-phosphate synthase II (EC [uncultured Campylobacterales bacterium]|uniref:Phospho-2-dehydro-3-deoxyheptonate aldolase n=1 Tax=uncultured Campylobacterales bacterium TaxID=352960 RepID=A0A6S6SJ56_9BACT|nr:MAG: 2-keto-3-deoxy-D-arabino-heptulosonate-7-phosphate synthase II (EC [uncultured Campylobacterales bacterium]